MNVKFPEKTEVRNYGLIVPDETPKENYLLGGRSKIRGAELNPSGNWTPWLVERESQKRKFETQNCTGFGSNNAVEILLNFLGNPGMNYSDRALGIAADTDPYRGNSPYVVLDTIRKKLGCVPEPVLPFSNDLESVGQYYAPKPLPQSIIDEGNKWGWTLGYEDAFKRSDPLETKQFFLKEALKRSPVGISVYAWAERNGLYYKPEGATDTHWCVLIGYEDGKHWTIFDSYDGFVKNLEWNTNFDIGVVIYLTPASQTLSIFQQILNLIGKLLPFLSIQVRQALKPLPKPKEAETSEPIDLFPEVKKSKVTDMARAIQSYESAPPSWNNPGAFRYTKLMEELGASGFVKTKSGTFCLFPTYEKGFEALCEFIRLAGRNELKYYKNCTIGSFFSVYAPVKDNNNPVAYANFVAKWISEKVETKLASIL